MHSTLYPTPTTYNITDVGSLLYVDDGRGLGKSAFEMYAEKLYLLHTKFHFILSC